MNIFTVSFFGHRELSNIFEIEKQLEKIIADLIIHKEYVEFLIGRNGDFDLLTSSVIRRMKEKYDCGNVSLVLVLPYSSAEYQDNQNGYNEYYDEIEICSESAQAHFKAAIQIRNKCMVDRSDLIVCCIQRKSGGAYQTIRYAEKRKCEIINVAVNI